MLRATKFKSKRLKQLCECVRDKAGACKHLCVLVHLLRMVSGTYSGTVIDGVCPLWTGESVFKKLKQTAVELNFTRT